MPGENRWTAKEKDVNFTDEQDKDKNKYSKWEAAIAEKADISAKQVGNPDTSTNIDKKLAIRGDKPLEERVNGHGFYSPREYVLNRSQKETDADINR